MLLHCIATNETDNVAQETASTPNKLSGTVKKKGI